MKKLAALLCMALLVACSSNDKIDLEPAELVDIDSEASIDVVWSHGAGSGQGEKYLLLQPAVSGDTVFTADFKGRVFAFDRHKGKRLWKQDTETTLVGGVGLGIGRIFVSTVSGELLALNAENGELVWRTQLSSEVLAPATGNGDVVVLQAQDGAVVGLNAADGIQRWRFDNALPALTLRGTSAPLLHGGVVYVGLASGKVQAFSASDGILLWDQRIALAQGRSELERVIDIDGSPYLVGDILLCASYQGRLMALNRSTGRPIWAKDTSTVHNLSAGLGYVFLTDDRDVVTAYNVGSGQVVWTNDQLVRRQVGAPQAVGSYLAVADADGYVHIMSQIDGRFVARRKVDGSGIRAPMTAVGDMLYVLSNDGDLEVLRIEP